MRAAGSSSALSTTSSSPRIRPSPCSSMTRSWNACPPCASDSAIGPRSDIRSPGFRLERLQARDGSPGASNLGEKRMTTTTASASLWETLDHTPSRRQREFLRYLTATLVDLAVLGLFVEYWEYVFA